MANRIAVSISAAALLAAIIFLGVAMTGHLVQMTDYGDMCATDADCPGERCCIMYKDQNLGLCMEDCKSVDFLCKADSECAEGTVCCLSDGRQYGICNQPDKCVSVDLFAKYVENGEAAEKRQAGLLVESPAPIDPNRIIMFETIVIIGLLAFIIWMLLRREKPAK